MSYGTRQELYQKIEECRGRPLIAYVTTIRPGLVGHMAQDAIEHIIDQIRLIPKEQEEIDFLIISSTGRVQSESTVSLYSIINSDSLRCSQALTPVSSV